MTDQPRKQHGFQRTKCGCEMCCAPCRFIPGGLDPADLPRLCPEERNVFAWAEEHLRALVDFPYPTLVPARQPNGHCHWLFEGKCVVHENAPYGCAFFDSHMPPEEEKRRYAATAQSRRDDVADEGLYYRVWLYLCQRGLTGKLGDRKALLEEARKIRCTSECKATP